MGRGSGVETLESYVKRLKGRSLFNTIRAVYMQIARGVLELEDPSPPKSFAEYMLRPDYSLWLYTVTALLLATLLCIAIPVKVLEPFRWFLGTLFTLFIPGYVTVEALYPDENSLKPLERVALSIGLSLAITPLLGLLLNYTPWGIRLGPVTTALSLYTTIVMIIASYRKYELVRLVSRARKSYRLSSSK
jgi:uncharacterized membrane protein